MLEKSSRGAIMKTESDQLEQQARQARARMSGTLETLRGRMTPGQVVDQLADYARKGPAADFVRNLGREVRENPLPLTLVAVGVAWLIIASGRSSRNRAEQSRKSAAIGRELAAQEIAASALQPRLATDPESPGDDVRQDARPLEQAHEQR
jgi:hypothetical protein